MEVSQISRNLAKCLLLNEDLCETLSLAHDLGHPPFGHAGENVLNDCMNNFGGFDHNLQTLRIVSFLENKYYKFYGLNLTAETLDGLIKHNGPVFNYKKFNKIVGEGIFKKKINLKTSPSLEAQVSSISDDIAYNNHDLEDGLRAGIFKFDDLINVPFIKIFVKKHKKKLKQHRREIVINHIIRDMINSMILDVVKNANYNLKNLRPKKIGDIYNLKSPAVDFSNEMKVNLEHIRFFLREKMYKNFNIVKNINKSEKIIRFLFKKLLNGGNRFLRKDLIIKSSKERAISDYISGMTDRYAINLYRSLK
jgi:dGTPase